MKKFQKLLAAVLGAFMSVSVLGACIGTTPPQPTATEFNGVKYAGDAFLDLVSADGNQSLNTAVMFDANAYITYNNDADWNNAADGNNYKRNTENPMLKPVWKALQNRLDISFVNKSGGANNLEGQWGAAYSANFDGYDIINGSTEKINSQGEQHKSFVDLKPFLNRMPNLKAFLESNQFVADTILTGSGSMYYAPYFDGYDDIERMFILRADWVRKLLDGAVGEGDVETISTLNAYTPFMPSSLPAVTVNVTNKEGTQAVSMTKSATENIITKMNALSNPTGIQLVDTFKAYITARYGNFYGSTPSDLFVGQNAAYDADELVALLRLVKANPKFITGNATFTSASIIPFYPRSFTNDRTADILRLAQIWGVRGLDTPNGYFFVGEDGTLRDARLEDDTFYGIKKLNELYKEGLILENFNTKGTLGSYGLWQGAFNDKEWRGYLNSENRGFMTYDFNQTTTLLNGLDGEVSATGPHMTTGSRVISGFDLTPVIHPFSVWKGKTYNSSKDLILPSTINSDNYYRFTESWRSVKPDGWSISSMLTGKKLERALALFDYMYTSEGGKLMSFGPDEWIANDNTNPSGGVGSKAEGTITYMGKEIPKLATQSFTELKNLANGNYTNYYRRFLGGAMPIGYVKDQGMEYQMTHEKGKAGQDKISNAVLTGTLKHAIVGGDYYTVSDKSMRTVPTTFAYTTTEESIIKSNFISLYSEFSLATTESSAGANIFYKYIVSGFGTAASGDPYGSTKLTHAGLMAYIANSGASGSIKHLNCQGFLDNVARPAYARTSTK